MKIITDSAADLLPEEIKSLNISVVPLLIQFPEGEVCSENISADEFYNRLREMKPEIPSTSLPSSGTFQEIYGKLSEEGEEILSIHISSGLSGTVSAARLATRHVQGTEITVVDTLTLSGGQRFQVLAAAQAARAGLHKQIILERLGRLRSATEVVFTLETLEYLARGGRIGRVQTLAGSLLKIKPVIYVDKKDGKYNTAGRERTLKQALVSISDHLVKAYGPTLPLWVSVMHGQFAEQADLLADMLSEKLSVAKLEILRVSPVLGVHTGPGIVGAAVVPVQEMGDL